jgi:pimeloyl-ACP methyl ester carboxylesterase
LPVFQGMKHKLLTYNNSQISYYEFGTGPRPALCFHGYAENATMYSFLENYLGNEYTFFAVDLPFHGETQWNEGLTFTYKQLREIIAKILDPADHVAKPVMTPMESYSEKLRGVSQKSFIEKPKLTLIGFSLGGRVALSFYQSQPDRVEKVLLLAPDGLKVNFWYWLSTRTWIGNKLFAFTMKHPGWFFGFLKLVNKLGMVNASVFKFVNFYIGKKDARILLYHRWTSLRRLKPNLDTIRSLVREYKTPVRLIYGRHDRIILPVRGEQFKKGIEEYSVLTIIESGHQVLHEKHAEEIVKALKG